MTAGIVLGIGIALLQSGLTTVALKWAWTKSYFYWVWGAGFFFRLFVFSGTAFVVYKYTHLNLVATLLSLVVATTLFLVVESWVFLKPRQK